MTTFFALTDASYDGVNRRAAFGVWAYGLDRSGMSIQDAAVVRGIVADSTAAEVFAAVEGSMLVADRLVRPGDEIVVVTDNAFALEAINNPQMRLRPDIFRVMRGLRNRMADEGFTVRAVHVKAHKQVESLPRALNQWCDRAARAALAEATAHDFFRVAEAADLKIA